MERYVSIFQTTDSNRINKDKFYCIFPALKDRVLYKKLKDRFLKFKTPEDGQLLIPQIPIIFIINNKSEEALEIIKRSDFCFIKEAGDIDSFFLFWWEEEEEDCFSEDCFSGIIRVYQLQCFEG